MSSSQSLCQKSGKAVDWFNQSKNISMDSYSNCYYYCNILTYRNTEEEIRNGAMPWIGLYVAAASLIYSLAVAADVFLGFRNKKLWFLCKFFTLNAVFLTLLAVVMKLVVDLSTDMSIFSDKLAKISSSVFICTVMGNLMPSLGKMNDKEIFVNIAALGILVVTILVNLWIELYNSLHITGLNDYRLTIQHIPNILITPIMLILCVIMSSYALYVSSSKKYIDLRYHEIHKTSSTEKSDIIRKFNVDTLREKVRKYWMMVQTGSPQFVIVRSVTCVVSEAICILTALLLVVIELIEYRYLSHPHIFLQYSSYKWSTSVVFVIQTIGIGVGTIACAFRVFTTIKLKCSGLRGKKLQN